MDQISQKHRGKHSQQNISVLNPTLYKKIINLKHLTFIMSMQGYTFKNQFL